MRKIWTNEKGLSMVMVVGFLALAVPVVTAALALAGTLSRDSAVKNRLAIGQYNNLGVQEYIEHLADNPDDLQEWVDTGCDDTVDINGEVITLSCDPAAPPEDSPSAMSRQLRTFKEVQPGQVPGAPTISEFTYTIRVYNDAGLDTKTHHRHLGHGYWKQPHHFTSWQVFDQDDLFDTVFALVNQNPGLTLLEALEEGGGHKTAFNRDAVTALLNAAGRPGIFFPYTVAQVKNFVAQAYATGNFDYYKHLLRGQNHKACFDEDVVVVGGADECDHYDDDDEDDDGQAGREALRRIYDGLPPGFQYLPGSTKINGVAAGDPSIRYKRDKDYDSDDDGSEDDGSTDGHLGPSYWKNAVNYANFTGFPSTTRFSAIFGVGPSDTLMRVLNSTGGGLDGDLLREAVASLLNAAHPDIMFKYDGAEQEPADVISLVQAAYSIGDNKTYTRNKLQSANNKAYYMQTGRTMLIWDLKDLDIHLPSGELLELEFKARAAPKVGTYCNEAWVEPGRKDHDNDDHGDDDEDDDGHKWGRGTGTDMTARVKAGSPPEQLCPGEAVYITTRVDPEMVAAGAAKVFTYTVEIENVGTTTLNIARINDILPEGLTYVANSAGGNLTDNEPVVSPFVVAGVEEGTHLQWEKPFGGSLDAPELEPGDTVILTFQAEGTVDWGNHSNQVWVYFEEYSGSTKASYSWPTAVIRAMDVFEVTATDANGNVIGTYQVWVGTDETIVR